MKRAGMLLAAYLVAVACLWAAASATGVASGEDAQLSAARAIGAFFDRVGTGDASLFDQPARDAAWSPVHRHVSAPTMLSGLVWHVASSGYQWWGELLSLRLGFVLFTALSIPLLLSLMMPLRGARAALLAAGFLAFVPRAMHQAVIADPRSLTVTGWLIVLLCYARARHAATRRRAVIWSLTAGAALGLAVASSHGSLVVVLVPVAHTLWVERHRLRPMLREGLLPVPASLLAMVALAPAVYFLLTPWLWHDTAQRVRSLFVHAFSRAPDGVADASSLGVLATVTSVPAVTLCAAAVGLAVLAGPSRVRAWARAQVPERDRTEGSLLVVALIVGLAWPWIAPSTMHATPPRWLVCLPFVAGLAGIGLDVATREIQARLSGRPTWSRVGAVAAMIALSLGVPLAQTYREPETRSAAFTTLSGGPAWVASHDGSLPLHDASPLSALIPAIDSLGRGSVAVFAPPIPPDVWQAEQRFGRLRTKVRIVASPDQADMLILGPDHAELVGRAAELGRGPELVASVARDGVPLLSAYVVKRRKGPTARQDSSTDRSARHMATTD